MTQTNLANRREFLRLAAVAAGAWAVAGPRAPAVAQGRESDDVWKQIGPVEDLMREHGILHRVLLIYQEAICRIREHEVLPLGTLADAADIIRRFIHEYHEQLEETYLFPRFERAGMRLDLVKTLRRQHRAASDLTEEILHLAGAAVFKIPSNRERLAAKLAAFIRMYRPHAAREDTVLFPAFRDVVSCREYHALGERFEDEEQDLFGVRGFERMVDRVAAIEQTLCIHDLNDFTPSPAES
jgi:hemerythrin-like domain-containing protein